MTSKPKSKSKSLRWPHDVSTILRERFGERLTPKLHIELRDLIEDISAQSYDAGRDDA